MPGYFELFGLPEHFELDDAALEARYRTLAAQFHPDRSAAASAFEQRQAVMMASAVNQAYQALKDPLERAAYLLELRGINADAPEHTAYAPEFLMQQMEWREQLADAAAAQDAAAMRSLDQEIAQVQNELYRELAAAFAESRFEPAADLLRRGRFLAKMRQEVYAALPE